MQKEPKSFVMRSDVPSVIHRRESERPHLAMEVREGHRYGDAFGWEAAEEFVRHLDAVGAGTRTRSLAEP